MVHRDRALAWLNLVPTSGGGGDGASRRGMVGTDVCPKVDPSHSYIWAARKGDPIICPRYKLVNLKRTGVRFTKVFRTELGHKYILVECSVIALCLPVMSKMSRYNLVCYK